jgi:nucleotide-binding universal stress UspA family protein
MLEKILVCLDGSKEAEQILPYITGDTKFSNSELILFRVISLPDVTIPVSVPGEPGMPLSTGAIWKQIQTRQDEAMFYLQNIAASLRNMGLNIDYAIMPGTAGDTIVHYALQNGITLIAIATHGHGVARRFFVGSTADFVARHSPIPVLLIRPILQ